MSVVHSIIRLKPERSLDPHLINKPGKDRAVLYYFGYVDHLWRAGVVYGSGLRLVDHLWRAGVVYGSGLRLVDYFMVHSSSPEGTAHDQIKPTDDALTRGRHNYTTSEARRQD